MPNKKVFGLTLKDTIEPDALLEYGFDKRESEVDTNYIYLSKTRYITYSVKYRYFIMVITSPSITWNATAEAKKIKPFLKTLQNGVLDILAPITL